TRRRERASAGAPRQGPGVSARQRGVRPRRGAGMSLLAWLVPVALGMGAVGLVAFLCSMKSVQLEDLDGAAERVLLHEADDSRWPWAWARSASCSFCVL